MSDNAANNKNAINILNLKHFRCFAHSLNLVVQEALKSQSNLIGIKNIVGHFKRSSNANHKLMMYQQNSGENPKKLLQDEAT